MANKEKQIEEMAKAICHAPTCEIRKNGDTCYKYCKAYIYAFRAVNAGYRKSQDVAREIDDLRRYIILNEDIAIKCKEENGEKNEEYWKGKLSAFKQIRAYIDAELKKKYTESEKEK